MCRHSSRPEEDEWLSPRVTKQQLTQIISHVLYANIIARTLTLDVEEGAQVVIVDQVQLGTDHIQVLYKTCNDHALIL